MRRSALLVSIVICLVGTAVAVASPSHLPKANTREALVKYVQEAAKVVEAGGPSCTTFSSTAWQGGDYYIFVSGPDGKTICHPNAKVVGQPTSAIVNSKGEKVGDKIQKAGTGTGSGWVEYLWSRPGKTAEEPKSTYVIGVNAKDGKHYIVGSGAWDLKK